MYYNNYMCVYVLSIWYSSVFLLHPLSYDPFYWCDSKYHLHAEYFQIHAARFATFSEFHPGILHSFLEISFFYVLKSQGPKKSNSAFDYYPLPSNLNSQLFKSVSLSFVPFHLMDSLYTIPLSMPKQENFAHLWFYSLPHYLPPVISPGS